VGPGVDADSDDRDPGHERNGDDLEVSGATGIQKRRAHRSLHALMPRWAAFA
jgi:hypothetical protein